MFHEGYRKVKKGDRKVPTRVRMILVSVIITNHSKHSVIMCKNYSKNFNTYELNNKRDMKMK